jgi:TonB family protein
MVLPEVTVTPYVNLLSTVTVYGTALSAGAEELVLNFRILGYVYLAGVVYFAALFFFRMFQISRLIARNPVVRDGNIKLVELDRQLTPFSFLNYIFVSKNLRQTEGWEKMMEHEKQHILQGHTIDVLILEVLSVFQWFNPFFWMFRRALRENHEFMADQAVISHGTAPSKYKQILLNQYVGEQIVLANNFNYSLIKTRIKMISKIKSGKMAIAKVFIGFVLAFSLVSAFAFENSKTIESKLTSAEQKEKVYTKVEQMPEYKGEQQEKVYLKVDQMPEFNGGQQGQQELLKYLLKSINYPEEARKKGIQGKVYVTFVVDKEGSVKDVKIARGVDPALDAEAVRVVSSMPKWTPGKEKGKNVAVSFAVPINFALK